MQKVKFFLIVLCGLIMGTILHEIYHYLAANNPRIVFSNYGIGIASKNGSSELVAYSITILTTIIFFLIAIYGKNKNKISK